MNKSTKSCGFKYYYQNNINKIDNMKDFLGKELNIGDEVVFIAYDRDLEHGIVTRITEKTATILPDNRNEFRRELSKVFKVESKQAILDKLCKWIKEHLYDEEYLFRDDEGTWVDSDLLLEDLKKYIKEEI